MNTKQYTHLSIVHTNIVILYQLVWVSLYYYPL